MIKQNLSQWFLLSEQKPWEVGVYEVEDSWSCIWSCRWDGEKFLAQAKSCGVANLQTHPATIFIVKWRGLSTNPEKPKKANKRKTMHVVMYHDRPMGAFDNKEDAYKYRKNLGYGFVNKIRFRTPE